jgi:hypothetical protein
MPYDSGLKHTPSGNDPERDEAGLNEVHVLNLLFWRLHNHAFSQCNRLHKSAYCRKIARQRCQNCISYKWPSAGLRKHRSPSDWSSAEGAHGYRASCIDEENGVAAFALPARISLKAIVLHAANTKQFLPTRSPSTNNHPGVDNGRPGLSRPIQIIRHVMTQPYQRDIGFDYPRLRRIASAATIVADIH